MPDTANVALVRRLYDSKGDPAVAAQVLASDIVWDITPGFPLGGVYRGLEAVGRDFFGRTSRLWASLQAEAEAVYSGGDDHVVALGHYHATTHEGRTADIRFIHVWTVREGRLAHLQQAADSHVARQALDA